MSDPFAFCDDLGPEKIIAIHDPSVALKAVLVIDNVACGPSIGGCRMAPDVSVEECFRLARAMTLKNASAGLPHGGGKSVIFADPAIPRADKERMIRAFARAIADIGDYIVGPDMGTDETAMAWAHDEIGRAVGLPRVLGGIPLDEIGATGFGLAVAAEVASEYAGFDLNGARVAVQGFGAVGRHGSQFLAVRGAKLVAVSDSGGTLSDPAGLDIEAVGALKDAGNSVVDAGFGEKADRDAVIGVDCDIWIPAARPDVINAGNVDEIKAKLILQGANVPATLDAEHRLHERGVLSVPDFIANAGGVICAAVEYSGGSETGAFASIEEKIRANTRAVLEEARATEQEPRAVAERIARHRVEEAIGYRR